MSNIKSYLDWRKPFTQGDLLVVYIASFLTLLMVGLAEKAYAQHQWSQWLYCVVYPLGLYQGLAIGKRFLDLGYSVWYGIAGMLMPPVALGLLFIPGQSSKREKKREKTRSDDDQAIASDG